MWNSFYKKFSLFPYIALLLLLCSLVRSANSSGRPRRIGSPSDSSKALSSSWTAVSDCNAVRVGTVALWVVHWPWFCVLTFAGFGAAILDWLSCAIADLTRASSILARVNSSSNFKFSFWSLLILAAFIDLAYLQTLFKLSFQQVPADHQVALKVITYVECALSLIGEALTAFAYYVLMWVTNNIPS